MTDIYTSCEHNQTKDFKIKLCLNRAFSKVDSYNKNRL